jgi:hypothetical protein
MATIGQVRITNPPLSPTFEPQYPLDSYSLSPDLQLLGFNQDREAALAGDSVLLTLFWECAEPAGCEHFALQLVDESGVAVAEWRLPTIRQGFAAGDWPAHGRLRGQHIVQLPATLANGRYRFLVENLPLGEIAVTAPERQFSPPPLTQQTDATFASAGGTTITTLAGITSEPSLPLCLTATAPDATCALPLVWRGESETSTSYHVFIHIVDAEGNILAQSDGVPANWTRPTTGWLPGEYVVDTHALTLPAELPSGPLWLRVGLYDPQTGARLRIGGGEEFATIPLMVSP